MLQFTSDEMRPEKLDENEIAALIANGRDTISLDVAEVSVGKSTVVRSPSL